MDYDRWACFCFFKFGNLSSSMQKVQGRKSINTDEIEENVR